MAVLKEGSKAPIFKGVDQNGKAISLADFKGKKVILYFYPKDDTPTCTVQACNLRDNYAALIKKGYHVIGVSTDNVKSHKKFEEKFKFGKGTQVAKDVIRKYVDYLEIDRPLYKDHNKMKELIISCEILHQVEKTVGSLE